MPYPVTLICNSWYICAFFLFNPCNKCNKVYFCVKQALSLRQDKLRNCTWAGHLDSSKKLRAWNFSFASRGHCTHCGRMGKRRCLQPSALSPEQYGMCSNVRFLKNTHHDASPGSEAWSYTSGLLTGRAIVTSLMHLPLNPFWNKVKYQEFKKGSHSCYLFLWLLDIGIA